MQTVDYIKHKIKITTEDYTTVLQNLNGMTMKK
jgi:hypothetical protein